MSSHFESYCIYDVCTFNLENKMRHGGLFQSLNTEYEYFRIPRVNDRPDFTITISDLQSDISINYTRDSDYFNLSNSSTRLYAKIIISDITLEISDLIILTKLSGFRKILQYSAIKNVFTRSLLTLQLINNNCTLIHGAGISKNDEASIFIGRPGVFKTTITMKLLREFQCKFLGDENILFKDNMIYPFPLNLKSFSYKFINWEFEDPPSRFQKLILGKHILIGKKTSTLRIAESCPLKNVFYIAKGNDFSIKKIKYNNQFLEKCIDNEILELGICPTHFISGIDSNLFELLLEKNNQKKLLDKTWRNLKDLYRNLIFNKNLFEVTVPPVYSNKIHTEISNIISNEIRKTS